MILDDLDDPHDSPAVVTKKLRTLGRSLLPAGNDTLAVLAVQNGDSSRRRVRPPRRQHRRVPRRLHPLRPYPALTGNFSFETVPVTDHDDPDTRPWRIIGDPARQVR